MATGDIDDLIARQRTQIPPSWFPEDDAVLAGVLAVFGSVYAFVYGLIVWAKAQLRLSTMSGVFLDLFAFDFFGRRIRRRSGELDDAWQARISRELLRERCTRAGMASVLTDLTGTAPTIVEPWNTGDMGAFDDGSLAFDTVGGTGDTDLPYQAFITVKSPGLTGVPGISGFDDGAGAFDGGDLAFVDPSMISGAVTDQDIYDAINLTKPAGMIAWVRLT